MKTRSLLWIDSILGLLMVAGIVGYWVKGSVGGVLAALSVLTTQVVFPCYIHFRLDHDIRNLAEPDVRRECILTGAPTGQLLLLRARRSLRGLAIPQLAWGLTIIYFLAEWVRNATGVGRESVHLFAILLMPVPVSALGICERLVGLTSRRFRLLSQPVLWMLTSAFGPITVLGLMPIITNPSTPPTVVRVLFALPVVVLCLVLLLIPLRLRRAIALYSRLPDA